MGSWLPCLSQGAWEDVANFQVILSVLGPPSPFLLSLQGSRGPKGYKVSMAVGTCVLPHGWVLSDLRLTLWSLPLTGREGQAWH